MVMFEWAAKLAYLNILWILFSIFGVIIFGFFPSTVTMFIVIRKWAQEGHNELSIQEYFQVFKREFLASNKLGLFFALIVFLLYINTQYMFFYDYGFHQMLKLPLTIVMIVAGLMLFYVIPVYVHFHLKTWDVFKYALLLMITHPLYNIGMFVCIALIFVITLFLPQMIFFFLGSTTAYVIMHTCLLVFKKVSEKGEELQLTSIN